MRGRRESRAQAFPGAGCRWHDRRMSAQPPPPAGAAKPGDAPRGPRLPTPAPRRFRWGWWAAWIIGLFVINYVFASRSMHAQPRIRVPYSPYFLRQVTAGHVASITSKGTTVQGTFTVPERYAGSKPATRFQTEIPTFADTKAL